ncbi:GAF domain-containing sensor histidine kinase [Terrabacter sp. 2RAF25]|uniref:GAF domain-containing sensor histidine kinase n=1 Tax=Terrabacter sp. 2RAF25 TaxID=3232998 RepID=UPI003F97E071
MVETVVSGSAGQGSSEDRLRGLLAANRSVVSELALPAVLRRIVDAARVVSGADYAALGVIGADGRLEQFVHSGMDPATVERIGHLPTGTGVLGAVIDDAAPIRLHSIAADPRASGFPDGHPPMGTFLGVPVRSRGQVYGNLYLADRFDGADFSADDEDLVVALAASAGIAIENARLYEESRRRQEWLRASAEISRDLLRPGLGEVVLVRIADAVLRLADADTVTIDLPTRRPPATGDGAPARQPYAAELVVEVARGVGAEGRVGTTYAAAPSLAGRAMRERRAVLTEPAGHGSGADLDTLIDAEVEAEVEAEVDAEVDADGPAMACPLVGDAGVRGVVVVTRGPGRPPFSPADVEMAEQLATHAAVALELADRRADEERVAVLEDRHRIARDLHDHVIQRIFATGLTLDSVAEHAHGSLSDDEPDGQDVREILSRAVEDLDETIRQIRASIFELQEPTGVTGSRTRLREVVTATSAPLGFEPALRLDGPVASVLDASLLHDVTAVLREALTNVVRHARAHAVDVRVSVTGPMFCVEVTDDGPCGRGGAAAGAAVVPEHAGSATPVRPEPGHRGLANLASRAEARGGHCSLRSDERTTVLTWTARLDR